MQATELVTICAWCHPDTSQTKPEDSHGMCQPHMQAMVTDYMQNYHKRTVHALDTHTVQNVPAARQGTSLSSVPLYSDVEPYKLSERKDGYLIQFRCYIPCHAETFQIGFRQITDRGWIWFIDEYEKTKGFVSSQVRMSVHPLDSQYLGYFERTPGNYKTLCYPCNSTCCLHARMMIAVINNEALADYANKRAACEKVRY